MYRIRKGDTVEVDKGKDRGKRGRVLEIFPNNKVLVEGVNLAKKHRRQTRQDQQGGIVSVEMPISISNLMFVCKGCNRKVRVGFTVLPDKTKARFCKACKETV